MCKATLRADAYNIQRDQKTGAFNISLNGIYSNTLRTFMYEHGFRWSKSHSCFYGWTRDIQSISYNIQKLVFDYRNEYNTKAPIAVKTVFDSDIETVAIYQNKRDYVAACKTSSPNVEKISILELLDDEATTPIELDITEKECKEKETSIEIEKSNDEAPVKVKEPKKHSHGFNVGDVLYASWGWEQTNLDFFIVTEATEKSIRIKECTMKQTLDEGYDSGMARNVAYDPKTAKPVEKSWCIKDQAGRGDLKRICSYELNGQKKTYVNFRYGHNLYHYEGKKLYESWYA